MENQIFFDVTVNSHEGEYLFKVNKRNVQDVGSLMIALRGEGFTFIVESCSL